MISSFFKSICRKNRQMPLFYSPKWLILLRCLRKAALCYFPFASHYVSSLADYLACLRRSLRHITSHLWPFSHRTPTMSQHVPTFGIFEELCCAQNHRKSCPNRIPTSTTEMWMRAIISLFWPIQKNIKHETDENCGSFVANLWLIKSRYFACFAFQMLAPRWLSW